MSSKKLGRPAKVLNKTRINSGRFAGKASDLPVSDLPTYKQLIQYGYKIEKELFNGQKIDSVSIVTKVNSDLQKLWYRVNPNLPLIKDKPLKNKISRTFKKVLSAERIQSKNHKSSISWLEKKLETLFDLSACRCDLPIIDDCKDR